MPMMDTMGPDMFATQGGDSEASFASGLLAGAGLREIRQVLGIGRKDGAKSQAEPPAAQLLQGQMGDVDKLLLLARMGTAGQQANALPGPGMPPGMPPMGPPPGPMGPPMGPPPMGAPPMGPPGPGMPPGGPMGPPPMPMLPPPPGPMPPPPGGPAPVPGGALSQMLLDQLLASAAGPV